MSCHYMSCWSDSSSAAVHLRKRNLNQIENSGQYSCHNTSGVFFIWILCYMLYECHSAGAMHDPLMFSL